jgi:uncharacterized protein (DUF2147 family)
MSILFVASMMMAQAPAAQAMPVQPTTQAAPVEKEKKICKVDENESSSRLRKRVCMTATEWDRAETGKDVTDLKSMGSH